jgi:hypothetical protein
MQDRASRSIAIARELVPSSWIPHISIASSSCFAAHAPQAARDGFWGFGVRRGIVASAALRPTITVVTSVETKRTFLIEIRSCLTLRSAQFHSSQATLNTLHLLKRIDGSPISIR